MAEQQQVKKTSSSQVTATPTRTGFLQTRPFAPTTNAASESLHQQATPDLQEQLELTRRVGHNFGQIGVQTSSSSIIQPKLTIGSPGDKYEQEADRVAAEVVNRINAPASQSATQAQSIQRQEMPPMNPLKGRIQRQSSGGGVASEKIETFINQSRGGGQPLPNLLRRKMEGKMGADFSGVRIHTDTRADMLNRSLNARAFTTGNDIFFKSNEYNPDSTEGQKLIAHESTHVMQQNGNNLVQRVLQQTEREKKAEDEHVKRIRNARNPQKLNSQTSQDQIYQNSQDDIFNELKNLKSWDAVKEKYLNTPKMQEFVNYRKQYVDGKIKELKQKYPGLIAKSVGSNNLSSDYDITLSNVSTDPKRSGDDVKAVQEFNDLVKKEFGVQPGTLFDTNLYAKDFLKVEANIDLGDTKQQEDTDLAQPGQEFNKFSDLDQDVAALMKQRRFMNQVEWDKYTQQVVSQIKDEQKKQAVLHQYEEADSLYQIAAHELLAKSKKHLKRDKIKVKGKAELGKEEQEELAKVKDSNVRQMLEKQLIGMEELHLIAHEESDLVLEESNKLYVQRMAQVRQIQKRIQKLGNNAPEKVNVLKAEVKKLLGEACFFASEAYHSEGAVKHVVAGIQGANKEEALKQLTPEHILQSYNEQLGDFLKDIVHYTQAKASPGKTFYRSSKYLYRLFDAVLELRKREEFKNISLQIENSRHLAVLAKAVKDELVAIRGGDKKFDSETDQDDYAKNFVRQTFGVDTGEGLKQIVLAMSVEFNQKVRNLLSGLANPETTKEYFKNIKVK